MTETTKEAMTEEKKVGGVKIGDVFKDINVSEFPKQENEETTEAKETVQNDGTHSETTEFKRKPFPVVNVIDSITIDGTSTQFDYNKLRIEFFLKKTSRWIDGERYEKLIPTFRIVTIGKNDDAVHFFGALTFSALTYTEDFKRIADAVEELKTHPKVKEVLEKNSKKKFTKSFNSFNKKD